MGIGMEHPSETDTAYLLLLVLRPLRRSATYSCTVCTLHKGTWHWSMLHMHPVYPCLGLLYLEHRASASLH